MRQLSLISLTSILLAQKLGKISAQPHTSLRMHILLVIHLIIKPHIWMHNEVWGCTEILPKIVQFMDDLALFTALHHLGSFEKNFVKFTKKIVIYRVRLGP